MSIQSRITKLEKEIETIKHTEYKNWTKKVVMSVKLRILQRKLHNLKVDLKKGK